MEVLKDELQLLVECAARVCPDCTLALLVEGLEHYLIQRTRREYKVENIHTAHVNLAAELMSVLAHSLSI